MKKKQIYLWATVSVLYVSGCLWLFFGTLDFDGLDLVMSRRDSQYQTDCWFTAARGFLVAQLPILCLWLEYRVTGRFGRLRIWWSRYCVSLLLAVLTAMYLWYRSHIPMTSPYRQENSSTGLLSGWCTLLWCICIMQCYRVRITSRKRSH